MRPTWTMRPACALALTLASACGGSDPVAVSVEMGLDGETCNLVPEPAALSFLCDTTAGVWLRGPAGQVLDGACVDFTGPSPSLADLPPLLAGIDLTTASSEGISVAVAVYAPWRSVNGCPPIEEVAASPGDVPEIIVSGTSAPTDLSASNGRIQVELACGPIALPSGEGEGEGEGEGPGDCELMCADQAEACRDDSEVLVCEEMFEQCDDDCEPGDDECEIQCDVDFAMCVDEIAVGACAIGYGECLNECDPEDTGCLGDCDGDYAICVNTICDEQFEDCQTGCADGGDGGDGGGEPGCAAVGP